MFNLLGPLDGSDFTYSELPLRPFSHKSIKMQTPKLISTASSSTSNFQEKSSQTHLFRRKLQEKKTACWDRKPRSPNNKREPKLEEEKHREVTFHLDRRAPKPLARDATVVADTALLPPKYHFWIISATFPFSTFSFTSSFPSVVNPICTVDSTNQWNLITSHSWPIKLP